MTKILSMAEESGKLITVSYINCSPWKAFSARSSKMKGIGEKRATHILELREESPEPFKNLDDLKEIGLSAKQIKGMMRREIGGLFN
ncbi:hypothetical protein CRYUN_Cryun12cG0091900 [Craigia yunnanensis]